MFAIVKFDTKKIVIELLDSPITNLWIDSLGKWNAADSPMKTVSQRLPYNSNTILYPFEQIVDKIYEAIENINSVIEGEKFPYIPYLDMPWEQTNLLHRCFTTSYASTKCWKHNLSTEQLLRGKEETYVTKLDFLKVHTKQTYTYGDNILLLRKHLSSLNKWVHFFENQRISLRSRNCFNEIPEFSYVELEWDTYNEFGQRVMLGMNRTSYQDILDTFDNPKSDECDVFLSKAILGKDYETSYFQYDDPLEIDTTNVDLITGGIRIFDQDYYTKLFGSNGKIIQWGTERGVPVEMIRQVPIGKVIHSEVDFTELRVDESKFYTCGTPLSQGIFQNPRIYLTEDYDNNISYEGLI